MPGNERSFRIEIPESIRASLVESVESGEFPEWVYAKGDVLLEEYVESRRGRFEEMGFSVFPDEKVASVNRPEVEIVDGVADRSNIVLVPDALLEVINEERRSVYRESYTLRFEFEDASWESVEDVWVEAYWVLTEPGDLY